ncbi:anti-sigma factor family protein [Desmospora profundinema]|uniref:Anti-sigma-W factor RsiW n=1 Tax=Desmospora profundinema TaxID=1571184 RepID=A0ABU1ILD8_9BACL|nr:zf-HC2 domain-containing protein [Desmospora profundinema]MDR6225597.1 hypothetical protein [Desmospora profundinema]
MICNDQGRLQAYLDGELTRSERKQLALHIEQCPECQALLQETKEMEDWVHVAITESLPDPDRSLEIDGDQAWQRFQNLSKRDGRTEAPSEDSMKWSWKKMKKTQKRWISGIAAAGILAASLTVPQVQAAASELLSVFRMDKVEFVKLTQGDLEEMSNFLENKETGSLDLKGLGKVWTEGEEEESIHHFDNPEKAVKAGHSLPEVPDGYQAVREVTVETPFTVHFRLDTEKINKLLKQLEADVELDKKLNNKTFAVEMPRSVFMNLKNEKSSSEIEYTVAETPQIEVEKEEDVDEIRKAVLSLPFIPENIKTQLLDIEDWKQTLPVPVFEDEGDVREVSINGAKGVIQEGEWWASLVWQKDGKIHNLSIYGEDVNSKELIQLAKKLN